MSPNESFDCRGPSDRSIFRNRNLIEDTIEVPLVQHDPIDGNAQNSKHYDSRFFGLRHTGATLLQFQQQPPVQSLQICLGASQNEPNVQALFWCSKVASGVSLEINTSRIRPRSLLARNVIMGRRHAVDPPLRGPSHYGD